MSFLKPALVEYSALTNTMLGHLSSLTQREYSYSEASVCAFNLASRYLKNMISHLFGTEDGKISNV